MTWFFRTVLWGGTLIFLLLTLSVEPAITFFAWLLYLGFYYGNRWWMRFTLRRRKFALYFITAFITAISIGTINLTFYADAAESLAKEAGALLITLGFLNYLFVFFLQTLSFQSTVVKDWFHGVHIEDKLTHTQGKLLKTELNPHLFKNMLNNIYSLVIQKKDEAADAIVKLQSFMEYMLYDSNGKKVPLKKEIAYINDLVEIEKLRLPPGFKLNFKVSGNPEGKHIAPLVLLPFIENVFRHGDMNGGEGFIEIAINVKDSRLEYAVKNKVAAAQQEQVKKGGIGLNNLRSRLDMTYPGLLGSKNYKLTSGSNGTIYSAQLEIYDLSPN